MYSQPVSSASCEAGAVCRSKLLGFPALAIFVHRPHSMEYPFGRQASRGSRNSAPGWAAAADRPYLIQFAHDCWTACAVDGPVNTESPGELGVSGITNCVDGNLRNVAFHELERFILAEISDHSEA